MSSWLSIVFLIALIIEPGVCGDLMCGDKMHADLQQLAVPTGWFTCYITYELDAATRGDACNTLLANVCQENYDSVGLLAAGGNFGCWHGRIGECQEASDATNNVILYCNRNNVQHTTRLTAWSGTDVLLGVGIKCPSGIPINYTPELTSCSNLTPPPTPTVTEEPQIVSTEAPQICLIDTAATFDWKTLTEDGIDIPQVTNLNIDVADDLTLTINVDVEYIVRASDSEQDMTDLGTTYVLDFEDFDGHSSSITEPNSCSNRLESDYAALDENDRYKISSENFYAIGTTDNMCYPPPCVDNPGIDDSGWMIELDESSCNTIRYIGTWSWPQLRECRNHVNAKTDSGKRQTYINDNNPNYLTLSGVFYVNMVSPLWNVDNDAYGGFYRVYQLLSQPFVIQVSKSVYVVGETDVNVMTMSIISVYKEDQDEDYALILLTETAEYMQLESPTLVNVPLNEGQYTLQIESTAETDTNCLNPKNYLCIQLWKIFATETSCTTDRDVLTGIGGISFSGDYEIKFLPKCRTGTPAEGFQYDFTEACNDWLLEHDTFNANKNGVVLSSKLTFVDEICISKTFNIQLDAEMNFYIDSGYLQSAAGELFEVGEGIVYSDIELNFRGNEETVFGSTLVNVWICTFPPLVPHTAPDPDGPNGDVTNADNGGCFNPHRDGFGDVNSKFFFHIFSSQTNLQAEDFQLIEDGTIQSDRIRFKFTVPNEIARDKLYVHAQIEVTLQQENPATRRVLLTNTNTNPIANKMSHLGSEIGITNEHINKRPNYNYPQEPINYPQPQAPLPNANPNTFLINLSSPWIIGIGSLLAVILAFNIIFMCYMNCNKQQRARVTFDSRRRNGYSSVKNIDSDVVNDSEVNAINVVSDQSN